MERKSVVDLQNQRVKVKKSGAKKLRLANHLGLLGVTILACLVAFLFNLSGDPAENLAIGLGYEGLFLLGICLLIGPLYLARQKRNPVNIHLRRDIGIWTALTSCLHIFFAFQIYQNGQILLYFFNQLNDQYLPQLNLFGLNNYVGLLAGVLMVLLLITSNDIALRLLKGKRWKLLQRATYPVFFLVIVHTFGYQLYNLRNEILVFTVISLVITVILAQTTGILVHRYRRQHQASVVAKPQRGTIVVRFPTETSDQPGSLVRRKLLTLGGAILVTGGVALVGFGKILGDTTVSPQATPSEIGQAAVIYPPVEFPFTASPSPVAPAQSVATVPSSPTPETVTSLPATTSTSSSTAPAKKVAPTSTSAPTATVTTKGIVVTTVAACPVNSAKNFTASDTGMSCVVVHEADGSVKAFSNLCTHEPFPLQYDKASQTLVCPKHQARFNAKTGNVIQGPARQALQQINVQLEGNNIVYPGS